MQEHENLLTLQPLTDNNIVSKTMVAKIAGSGLQFGHLKTIFQRKGYDGLSAVLKAKVSKGVRVSSKTAIISGICEFFENLDYNSS